MKHTPICNRVLIKRDAVEEERSTGGILLNGDLTNLAKEQIGNKGIILAMGPTAFFEEVNAGFDLPVKVGDHVCFKTTGVLTLKHDLDGEDKPIFPNCVMILDKDILSKEEKLQ